MLFPGTGKNTKTERLQIYFPRIPSLWLSCSEDFFATAIHCLAFFLLAIVMIVHVDGKGHLFYEPIWIQLLQR